MVYPSTSDGEMLSQGQLSATRTESKSEWIAIDADERVAAITQSQSAINATTLQQLIEPGTLQNGHFQSPLADG